MRIDGDGRLGQQLHLSAIRVAVATGLVGQRFGGGFGRVGYDGQGFGGAAAGSGVGLAPPSLALTSRLKASRLLPAAKNHKLR
jgi:hypothetical protein